jgi:hypothetical protein
LVDPIGSDVITIGPLQRYMRLAARETWDVRRRMFGVGCSAGISNLFRPCISEKSP